VTTVDPWSSKTRTTVRESWPYVFIECFPHNIGIKHELGECSPYVFRVNATERFRLPSGYEYSPSAVEINAAVEMVTIEVHSIHFRNDSLGVDENNAIKKSQIARRELRKLESACACFHLTVEVG